MQGFFYPVPGAAMVIFAGSMWGRSLRHCFLRMSLWSTNENMGFMAGHHCVHNHILLVWRMGAEEIRSTTAQTMDGRGLDKRLQRVRSI